MKRREFVANTALTAAGLATSSMIISCGPSKSESKLEKIGFQIYTVRNQVKDHLEATLEKLAGFGYDYAEIYGLTGEAVLGHPIQHVKKAFDDAGIEIRSAHCGTGFDGEVPGTMSYEWQKGVDAASELGVKHLVLAYLVENERKNLDDYKKVADLLNSCGEMSKKSSIQMGYHNHAFEFETMEGQIPMHFLMDQTDPDLVKLELDIYWSTKAKQNTIDLFRRYKGRINLWHVKDMKIEDESMTEVGAGRIDWKEVFANAELSGMTSFFVEQDGNWTNSDVESLGQSYTYLNDLRF